MTEPVPRARLRRLIRRARVGDTEAFEELVRPLADSLYRMAASCLRGRESDIADALQATVLAGWEHLGELERPAYFKTWLLRICINECRRITRSTRASEPLEAVPEALLADPSEHEMPAGGENEEFLALVHAAGDANAPAVALFYGEGCTVREIAGMLGISEEAVRQRLSRGRKRIAASLAQGEAEEAAPRPQPAKDAPQPPTASGAGPRAPNAGATALPHRRPTA
ncbi:sigma-70 family RNA polymerase sigma factor [Adlercreutzia caecimuris B7]|uniref:Sigma-70 family RNA polymerase sigma factor n=2 Tax=Adlercreutzia caecimuris TaxID=671266 RepID=R9KXW3_9ACTN|nr:sigma-70 family RNA polymerase sigma factor [Adlercreutzia caecimuris B7]